MDENLIKDAIDLLTKLIAIPSFSKEEHNTAQLIATFLASKGIACKQEGNNIYTWNRFASATKPTLLLNSHHDTVQPNKGYTLHPFHPAIKDGKLYGLGSNDAGGCLVSLIATFLHFYNREDLTYNIVLIASAEEEISGTEGIERVLPLVGNIDFGIVGEPTLLAMAVAERGLMVLDGMATGVAGHAARNEGTNALYIALEDIQIIRNFTFEKESKLLGRTKMTVTVIETDNRQHNVVPSQCRFVVDVRVNENYSFEEVLGLVRPAIRSELTPRSLRLKSTAIALNHPLVKAGLSLGKHYYGSPTTSDKALMPFPTLKMGPGDSARSHSADEFIYLREIESGILTYIQLLEKVLYTHQ